MCKQYQNAYLRHTSIAGRDCRIFFSKTSPPFDQSEPNGCSAVRLLRPKADSTATPSGNSGLAGLSTPSARKKFAAQFCPKNIFSLVASSVSHVGSRRAATRFSNASSDEHSRSSSRGITSAAEAMRLTFSTGSFCLGRGEPYRARASSFESWPGLATVQRLMWPRRLQVAQGNLRSHRTLRSRQGQQLIGLRLRCLFSRPVSIDYRLIPLEPMLRDYALREQDGLGHGRLTPRWQAPPDPNHLGFGFNLSHPGIADRNEP